MSGSVPNEDRYVKLPCGCLITFPEGDLDRGQIVLCKPHFKQDPFETLRVIARVGEAIKAREAVS